MNQFLKTTIALAAAITFVSPVFAAAKSTIDPAQQAQIEEVVHQYLLKKPEVLLEAMQVLQRKQYDEAQQTVQQTKKTAGQFSQPLFHQANDPIAGNPNGKITVVEFFDYQCPHCVDMAPVISSIVKSNPDLRIVFKEFPIRGPMSELASRAALASNKQGKYVEFNHALLIASQPLTQDSIFQIAKTVGLNVEQLKKDMNDSAIDNQLKMNRDLAQNLKLFGTPAFFIGKTDAKNNGVSYIPGQMNEKQLQDEINKVK